MKCSPIYKDEKGNVKNEDRLDVPGACSDDCIHWQACKQELNLPADYKLPHWIERKALPHEIEQGLYHQNKYGVKLRYIKVN